jgi:hypothetical protein
MALQDYLLIKLVLSKHIILVIGNTPNRKIRITYQASAIEYLWLALSIHLFLLGTVIEKK